MMPRWLIDAAGRTIGIATGRGEIRANLGPEQRFTYVRPQRSPAPQNSPPKITSENNRRPISLPPPATASNQASIEVEKQATPAPAPTPQLALL